MGELRRWFRIHRSIISVVHGYCNKWRLKANVSKSAVMVCSRDPVESGWN